MIDFLKNPRRLSFVIAGSLVVGFVSSQLYEKLTALSGPPISNISIAVLNSPVEEGGEVSVNIYRIKTRNDCLLKSMPYVEDQDGRHTKVEARVKTPKQQGRINMDHARVSFDVSGLKPGSYTMWNPIIYYCPDGEYPINQPPFKFRVKEKGE